MQRHIPLDFLKLEGLCQVLEAYHQTREELDGKGKNGNVVWRCYADCGGNGDRYHSNSSCTH